MRLQPPHFWLPALHKLVQRAPHPIHPVPSRNRASKQPYHPAKSRQQTSVPAACRPSVHPSRVIPTRQPSIPVQVLLPTVGANPLGHSGSSGEPPRAQAAARKGGRREKVGVSRPMSFSASRASSRPARQKTVPRVSQWSNHHTCVQFHMRVKQRASERVNSEAATSEQRAARASQPRPSDVPHTTEGRPFVLESGAGRPRHTAEPRTPFAIPHNEERRLCYAQTARTARRASSVLYRQLSKVRPKTSKQTT